MQANFHTNDPLDNWIDLLYQISWGLEFKSNEQLLQLKIKSKKLKNLYFSGQLTVPGPGVPPAIVSGKLVSDLILKDEKIIWSSFWKLL